MTHHHCGPVRRVLVVEDDPVCRHYTRSALRQQGYAVKAARCLGEALRVALAWRPELVLTDLNLPDGGGLDLVRRVRSNWPANRPPPRFVAMTAAGAGRDDTWAEVFCRVVHKPFDPACLAPLTGDPACGRAVGERAAHRLDRRARREIRRQLPRLATLLEAGRLDAAAALAHRLAASAAVCGATELGRGLQRFCDTCANAPGTAELAETFTAARRLARDFVEGVTSRPGSG